MARTLTLFVTGLTGWIPNKPWNDQQLSRIDVLVPEDGKPLDDDDYHTPKIVVPRELVASNTTHLKDVHLKDGLLFWNITGLSIDFGPTGPGRRFHYDLTRPGAPGAGEQSSPLGWTIRLRDHVPSHDGKPKTLSINQNQGVRARLALHDGQISSCFPTLDEAGHQFKWRFLANCNDSTGNAMLFSEGIYVDFGTVDQQITITGNAIDGSGRAESLTLRLPDQETFIELRNLMPANKNGRIPREQFHDGYDRKPIGHESFKESYSFISQTPVGVMPCGQPAGEGRTPERKDPGEATRPWALGGPFCPPVLFENP